MTLQPVAVLFPDAELWAATFLREALAARTESYTADVFVSSSVPSPRRDRMVVVRRDGGPASGLFDHPRLAVRTWATTEADATDLARLTAALLWAAPDGTPLTALTQVTGPTPVADESRQPLRYQMFELTMRGQVL